MPQVIEQKFVKGIKLLREYYIQHKTMIDILAQDDELFRAVKEISETDSESEIKFQS
ncbi:MAG: hypothetical protein OI715_00185 (plasmid) [Candidatus Methanoperedens sp.]|nr:MAG: hypothetical protein OI715_00185 [Candidatus Methanoperedens sp.]